MMSDRAGADNRISGPAGQNCLWATFPIPKKSRVEATASVASNDLHVKTTTERNRGPVHTYSEIPESTRGTKCQSSVVEAGDQKVRAVASFPRRGSPFHGTASGVTNRRGSLSAWAIATV